MGECESRSIMRYLASGMTYLTYLSYAAKRELPMLMIQAQN